MVKLFWKDTVISLSLLVASSQCEVYGVGPTTYKPTEESIHSYFGDRAGALVFTNKLDKIEIKPKKIGFTQENDVIKSLKYLIKMILSKKSSFKWYDKELKSWKL